MMGQTSNLEKQVRTLRKRSLFTLFLTWLALFFTVVGIAAGYKNFLRVHDKAIEAKVDAKATRSLLPELARRDSVEAWQQKVQRQLQAGSTQNQQELAQLKLVSETSAYVASTLDQQVQQLTRQQQTIQNPQRQANQWKVNEVRYLLQMALRKTQLEHDVMGAVRALELADELLMELGEVDLLAVRQLLAKDIVSLKNSQPLSPEALIKKIDQLVTDLKPIVFEEPVETKSVTAEDEGRNTVLSRVQASISKAVVIREYDKDLEKQIVGDTKTVRYELLRLKLESLKLLALQYQTVAYQRQLKQVKNILQQESPELLTESVTAQLVALEGFAARPELPVLNSLDQLDKVLATEAAQ